jgi:hypothetical protein
VLRKTATRIAARNPANAGLQRARDCAGDPGWPKFYLHGPARTAVPAINKTDECGQFCGRFRDSQSVPARACGFESNLRHQVTEQFGLIHGYC